MQRRTVLQIITAFFASIAGWFGFGHHQPFELVRLKGPRGLVSPKAQWFSPPAYEPVQTLLPEEAEGAQKLIRLGKAELPISPFEYTRTQSAANLAKLGPTITVPRVPQLVPADYVLEPQKGVEVMRLKNPPCQKTTMGVSNGPSPEFVNPSGPVARASNVWQPLETFQPAQAMAPMAGVRMISPTLLGTMRNPAIAAPVDISNDVEFQTITQRRTPMMDMLAKLDPKPPALSEEELQDQVHRRAAMDANYEELLANWDSQKFDPADVNRAFENSRPAIEKRFSRLNS